MSFRRSTRLLLGWFLILFLSVLYSCNPTQQTVIQKEVVVISDYCSLGDFIFSAEDLINNSIYLESVIPGTLHTGQAGLKLHKNILLSPDKSYYVEFRFVQSNYSESTGKCEVRVYKKDKSLIAIIKKANPWEQVFWFSDFVIFNGFGPQIGIITKRLR